MRVGRSQRYASRNDEATENQLVGSVLYYHSTIPHKLVHAVLPIIPFLPTHEVIHLALFDDRLFLWFGFFLKKYIFLLTGFQVNGYHFIIQGYFTILLLSG